MDIFMLDSSFFMRLRKVRLYRFSRSSELPFGVIRRYLEPNFSQIRQETYKVRLEN